MSTLDIAVEESGEIECHPQLKEAAFRTTQISL